MLREKSYSPFLGACTLHSGGSSCSHQLTSYSSSDISLSTSLPPWLFDGESWFSLFSSFVDGIPGSGNENENDTGASNPGVNVPWGGVGAGVEGKNENEV